MRRMEIPRKHGDRHVYSENGRGGWHISSLLDSRYPTTCGSRIASHSIPAAITAIAHYARFPAGLYIAFRNAPRDYRVNLESMKLGLMLYPPCIPLSDNYILRQLGELLETARNP